MTKISVYKKRGGLVKKQIYAVDLGALQNVGRRKSKVIKQGAILKEALLDESQSFDSSTDLVLLDSVLPDAIAVSLSWNVGDAGGTADNVLVFGDSITTLRYDIVSVLTGDDVIDDVLDDEIAVLENM